MPIALVTGAGVRIGSAIARRLAESGYDLLLHAHASTAGAEGIASEARAMGRRATVHVADLSTEQGVQQLAREVSSTTSSLDLLVHNAGLFERIPYEQVTRAAYRRMQAVNLEAPYFLTQALLPSLRAAPEPLVVHLTDVAGERPVKGYSHYSVSKAALLMLTRALAIELAPQIRVNAISPGTVIFPEDFDEATRAKVLARIPLGREGSAEDIAKAVLFLAREAPYITGQVLNVDGGRSARL